MAGQPPSHPASPDRPTPARFEAVVVGDLHLPSPVFRTDLFLEFLTAVADRTRTLVLNGDVFESLDQRKFTEAHFEVLRRLDEVAETTSVVWLVGNHDGPVELIRRVTGLRFRTRHLLDVGGRRWLIVHGDQFDKTVHNSPRLTAIGNKLYLLLQAVSGRRLGLARWLKRMTKKFSRNKARVRNGCLALAAELGADGVVAGHTHTVETYADGRRTYLNPGSWTDSAPCFVGINADRSLVLSAESWMDDHTRQAAGRPVAG
jgi:UDP-2,3-diacylglucosamine pyrophosphatase LpxH